MRYLCRCLSFRCHFSLIGVRYTIERKKAAVRPSGSDGCFFSGTMTMSGAAFPVKRKMRRRFIRRMTERHDYFRRANVSLMRFMASTMFSSLVA